jgi:hypothetical protein
VPSKANQRRAKPLRFYATLSTADPKMGDRDSRGLHLVSELVEAIPCSYPPPSLTHLFLTGLHDPQLVYAIKMITPSDELTFGNDQHCHATGTITTFEPGEDLSN